MLKRPPKEWMAALCKASCGLISGSKPAKRCANMDLPEPGGPTSSILSTKAPLGTLVLVQTAD
jgi:hypothetical protein